MDEMPFGGDDDDGGGDWITTFADMATLLMAFFVLLLSFAEMDVEKYAAVVGSMKDALGQEQDSKKKGLKVVEETTDAKTVKVKCSPAEVEKQVVGAMAADIDKQLQEKARVIRKKLSQLIKESLVSVERASDYIVIRIPENGMFGGGSARLGRQFKPILKQIRVALLAIEGEILIAGHTDDRPIRSRDLRSNWDLAAERAVSVVHELLVTKELKPHRLAAIGYGDSRPLAPNTDKKSRARNRRVEIVIKKLSKYKPVPKEVETKDGETKDGETKDGGTKDGETNDGGTKGGETKDGETKDGEAKDGEAKAADPKGSAPAPKEESPPADSKKAGLNPTPLPLPATP